jgi:hypothetical protein
MQIIDAHQRSRNPTNLNLPKGTTVIRRKRPKSGLDAATFVGLRCLRYDEAGRPGPCWYGYGSTRVMLMIPVASALTTTTCLASRRHPLGLFSTVDPECRGRGVNVPLWLPEVMTHES